MYLRTFDFAATSSEQERRMVQRIRLRRSRFRMKTATSNSSNSPTITIGDYNDVSCLWFLSKLSFERETVTEIGRATALKLSLYEPIFSTYD